MMRPEIDAFNAGVKVVIGHALASADAIERMPGFKETPAGFAAAALRALAEAETELLLSAKQDRQSAERTL